MDHPPSLSPPRIGQSAPDFSLPDLDGRIHALSGMRGRLLVLNFWSAECPWSARIDREVPGLLERWGGRAAWWSIAANANEPTDLLRSAALERDLAPVLLDQGARVADLYAAQTTPALYVVDPRGLLRYSGAFDDVSFRQRTPTRAYLVQAVDALLTGEEPPVSETLSYGCTIVRQV